MWKSPFLMTSFLGSLDQWEVASTKVSLPSCPGLQMEEDGQSQVFILLKPLLIMTTAAEVKVYLRYFHLPTESHPILQLEVSPLPFSS